MVEWKKLGEVMKIVRGASPRPITSYLTSDSNGVNWIKIGDVEPGAKYITRCIEKVTKEGAQKSRYLHSGDFVLSNSMSFGRPYILKIDGCIHDGWIAMSDFETHLSSGYLYEVLNSNRVQSYWKMKANNGGAMTNLNSDIVKDTIIPIPSLEEQTRIVGILDTFTSAIDNLKEQIAQRRKQYEFYRDQLLNLEGKEGVEMKTLGEIASVLRGKRLTKNLLDDNASYPVYHGGLEPLGRYTQYNREANTVMVINVGASAGTVGFCDCKFWSSDGCFCISYSELLNSKYLFYYLQTKTHYLQSQVRRAGIPTLDNPVVEKISVPIIFLQEQQRIVSILDTFEASIRNLEQQLAQREKQYEYYRNRLLSFEEAARG